MQETEETQFGFVDSPSSPLFNPEFKVTDLRKQLTPNMGQAQGRVLGRVLQPLNKQAACNLMLAVNIQQTCIQTKRDAIVGLGFESEVDQQKRKQKRELEQYQHEMAMQPPEAEPKPKPVKKIEELVAEPKEKSKAEETLDELCRDGFQPVLTAAGEDYENTGESFIEVIRDGSKIVALWHMASPLVHIFNEAEKPFFHYEVDGHGGTLKYAPFGELDRVKAKYPQAQMTELIHFRSPTSFHPDHGMITWGSCVPWLELAQMMMQYHFDYFQNRAVPDLILFLKGKKIPAKDVESLQKQLKETVGPGKRHRSLLVQIPDPEADVTLERLNADNREPFADLWESVVLQIVSSHRVPPLLAGVLISGKMAAANELPNALVAFQTLYVQQHQKVFELVLGRTLGGQDAGLGLTPQDFKLRKITDQFDMGQMDTMSRMRETATEAGQKGRKLSDGLKK